MLLVVAMALELLQVQLAKQEQGPWAMMSRVGIGSKDVVCMKHAAIYAQDWRQTCEHTVFVAAVVFRSCNGTVSQHVTNRQANAISNAPQLLFDSGK